MELENDPDVIICYQDEVHFMAESTVTRAWYPKGSRPKVKSYPGHKFVAYSGFVISETSELFTTKSDWFNYETTIVCIREFLASHPAEDGKHLYIVMDNASWHKKAKCLINEEGQYADIKETVTIIFLSPYSPDLNPIEQVWGLPGVRKIIADSERFLKS